MKKFILCIILFHISVNWVYSQSIEPTYVRGLKEALQEDRADTSRITVLRNLGKYYMSKYLIGQKRVDMDSAMVLLRQAIKLSELIHDDDRKYENIRTIGNAYIFLKDTVAARPYVTQALHYYTASRQFNKLARAWLMLGEALNRQNLSEQALQSYRQALIIELGNNLKIDEFFLRFRIIELEGLKLSRDETIKKCLSIIADFKDRKESVGKVYWMLARIYRYKGDLNKALGYSLAGVKDMELFGDTINRATYYAELAQNYEVLGQTEKSILYYKKTIAVRLNLAVSEDFIYRTEGFVIKGLIKLGHVKEALNEELSLEKRRPPQTIAGQAYVAQNKAYCYQALKKYDKAERYYFEMMKGLETAKVGGEIFSLALSDISNFYIEIKKYNKAQGYALRMGVMTVSIDNYKNSELLHFKIDSAVGNYQSALNHYSNYQHTKDSIFNESKSRQIAELQIKYETEQREKDIKYLKKESESQREKASQASKTRNLTFIGTVLLLIIVSLLYNSYRIARRASRQINLKNDSLKLLVAEKDDLLEEKEWLMKEIHHRVKNNLQIVMGLLQRQSSFINNKEALAAIRNSEQRMHAMALIHHKLYQSDSLTLVDMDEYIGEMLDYLRDSFDLSNRIQFHKEIECINLEINVAVPIGLILNEAITNAIKYAFPAYRNGSIEIALKKGFDKHYTLQIADNGIGLPPDFDMQNVNSMGYNLMKGLSKQIGGKFKLTSTAGVTVSIDFYPGFSRFD